MRKRVAMLVIVLLAGLLLTGFWVKWAGWQTAQAAQPASITAQIHYVDVDGVCGGHMPCYTHPQQAADAAMSGDTILLQDDIFTSTSVVSSEVQLLYLNKDLTIIGGYDDDYLEPPSGTTFFYPDSPNRIIYVDYTAAVTLSNLTLMGGDSMYGASALYVYGGVATLRDSVVTSNAGNGCSGIGAEMDAVVIVENNAIYANNSNGEQGFGGTICMWSALPGSRVAFNEIYNNTAADGVAMNLSASDVTIEANKIYSNVATAGSVAGILLTGGDYTLINNYLGENVSMQSPSALAIMGMSTAELIHNTFVGNSSFENAETILVELSSAIMYNNILSGTEMAGIAVPFSGNLLADTNMFFGVGTPFSVTVGVNLTNSYELIADPLFDPLVPYAILPESPAEGQAIPLLAVYDIDGRLRPLGTGPDLGAMEVGEAVQPQVHYVDVDGICNGHTPCYTHPQQAAYAAMPGDTILLQDDTFTGVSDVEGNFQLLYIDKDLSVIGGYGDDYQEPPSGSTVLDADAAGRVIHVDYMTAVTLSNLTLTGGDVIYGGPALNVYGGSAILRDSIVTANNGDDCAGIHADMNSSLVVENNTIYANHGGTGGAICTWGAVGMIAFNEIYNNTAADGAAMNLYDSYFVIEANKVYDNDAADGSAAGILLAVGDYRLINNYLGKNVSVQSPSAMAIKDGSTVALIHNTFIGNSSSENEDTILIETSMATMYNNILSGTESSGVAVQLGGSLTADTNMFFNVDTSFSVAADSAITNSNVLIADPLFDPLVPYAILPDSPAEGRAIPMFATYDIDGRLRYLGSGPDLGAMEAAASFSIDPVQDTLIYFVDPTGLTTTLFVPANTFSNYENIELFYSALQSPRHVSPNDLKYAGRAFELELSYITKTQVQPYMVYLPFVMPPYQVQYPIASFQESHFGSSLPAGRAIATPLAIKQQLNNPVTITLAYRDQDILDLNENSLLLYYWNGQSWVDVASTCPTPLPYQRDLDANQIAVAFCHLSDFILGGH